MIVFNGAGTNYVRDGLEIEPKKITLGGWSKEELDTTNLTNDEVKTAMLGKLKKYADVVFNLEFDPAVYGQIGEGNKLTKIVIDSVGSFDFWADVKQLGDIEFGIDELPVFDLTLTVTNLNDAGIETKPVFTPIP